MPQTNDIGVLVVGGRQDDFHGTSFIGHSYYGIPIGVQGIRLDRCPLHLRYHVEQRGLVDASSGDSGQVALPYSGFLQPLAPRMLITGDARVFLSDDVQMGGRELEQFLRQDYTGRDLLTPEGFMEAFHSTRDRYLEHSTRWNLPPHLQ